MFAQPMEIGGGPSSMPCGVYTLIASLLGEGIVTIVDAAALAGSCDAAPGVDATPFVAFDDGVYARGLAAFNDDRVVMARCLAIFVE
ncbi:hypothetical protein [Paraburkholderia sp.]|uniref:hypothetical protein n=1 Tax=Paraburkholderia sp. TaxID=1926495 RepID=UPI002F40E6B4